MLEIQIECDSRCLARCTSVIIVPEIAVSEPGYIKTMTTNADAHSKHEFYAMAQMAYYQNQDDELDIIAVHSPVMIRLQNNSEEIGSGMVIYRDESGEIHLLLHEHLNRKKLLEATNRYCTRWVRLDI